MWDCTSCNARVDEEFEACWSCSFGKDGLPLSAFQEEEQSELQAKDDNNNTITGEFNWGAFALTPLWLLFHKRVGAALALLSFNFLVKFASPGLWLFALLMQIVIALYFGYGANEIAWETKSYKSLQQLKARQQTWNIIGKIAFCLINIPVFILFLFNLYLSLFARKYR